MGVDKRKKAVETLVCDVQSSVRAMEVVTEEDLWTCTKDGNLAIRNLHRGDFVCSLPRVWGDALPWCIRLVECGSIPRVWVGFSDGIVRVFRAEFYTAERVMVGMCNKHSGGVHCLAEYFGTVFTGSCDFEIMQWHAETLQFIRQLNGHTSWVRCLLPDGPLLYSGGDDWCVRVWQPESGECLHSLKVHSGGVLCMARARGKIWTGSDDHQIGVFHSQDFGEIDRLFEHSAPVTSLVGVGGVVYSGSSDCVVCCWDAQRCTLRYKMQDHTSWVYNIISTTKRCSYQVLSSANDNTIRVMTHEEAFPMKPRHCLFDSAFDETFHEKIEGFSESLHGKLVDVRNELHAAQEEIASLKNTIRNMESEMEALRETKASAMSYLVAAKRSLQEKEQELDVVKTVNGIRKAKQDIAEDLQKFVDSIGLSELAAFAEKCSECLPVTDPSIKVYNDFAEKIRQSPKRGPANGISYRVGFRRVPPTTDKETQVQHKTCDASVGCGIYKCHASSNTDQPVACSYQKWSNPNQRDRIVPKFYQQTPNEYRRGSHQLVYNYSERKNKICHRDPEGYQRVSDSMYITCEVNPTGPTHFADCPCVSCSTVKPRPPKRACGPLPFLPLAKRHTAAHVWSREPMRSLGTTRDHALDHRRTPLVMGFVRF